MDNLSFSDRLSVIDRATSGTAQDMVRQVIRDTCSETPGTDYSEFVWENKLTNYRLAELRDVSSAQKLRGEDEVHVKAWYEGWKCDEEDVPQQHFAI